MSKEHELVGKMLHLLKDGLTPFVEKQLQSAYADTWASHVQAEKRNGVPYWDVTALLATINDEWNSVFSRVLKSPQRSLIIELRDWRNRWAHQDTLTLEDAYRAYDSAERLLVACSSQIATVVKQQKPIILRLIVEEEERQERERIAEEERARKEQQRRRELLADLFSKHLIQTESVTVQAIQSAVSKLPGMEKLTCEDITDYFQRRRNMIELERPKSTMSFSDNHEAPISTKSSVRYHGQLRVLEALRNAGLEGTRNSGSIITAYDPKSLGGARRMLRITAAADRNFSLKPEYNNIADVLLVYVWYATQPTKSLCYALSYEEALDIAERKGWTQTNSWKVEGYYYTTRPDNKLLALLNSYLMTPDKWRAAIAQTGTSNT